MFWSTLWRVIVVPIAFLVSAAFTLFVVVTLGMERITQAMHGKAQEGADSITAILDLLWQGYILASGLTLLPALAVVLIGEVGRIRSAVYYIVGGGAALAAIPLLARLGQGQEMVLPAPVVLQVLATAGFAGGFVYWLLAGRRA
jgi:hypothetical protein